MLFENKMQSVAWTLKCIVVTSIDRQHHFLLKEYKKQQLYNN